MSSLRRTHRNLSMIAAITVAAVATACGGDSSSPTTSSPPPSSTTTTVATTVVTTTTTTTSPPTTTTLAPAVVLEGELREILANWQAQNGAPGAAMTVLLPDGSEVTVENGVRNLETQEPIAPGEYWRIASVTKPMVSAVVLRLVERGLIDLEAPVATYLGDDWATGYILDGVDYGPLLTVAQILNHTDGFAEYAFDPGFFFLMSSRLDVPLDPTDVVDWAVQRGPQYVPGEEYSYNTVGHVVAGLIIEAVTGRPAEQVLRDELFDLVGADDAYLTPREFPPASVPSAYVQGDFVLAFELLPGLAEYRETAKVGEFYEVTAVPQEVITSAPFTGGGVEAQTDDVARVFRGLFDGTILSSASIDEFTTTVLDTNYGLGISVNTVVGTTVYSHGGGTLGFRSHAFYAPEFNITMAMSSTLIPVEPDVGTLADEVLAAVLAVVET